MHISHVARRRAAAKRKKLKSMHSKSTDEEEDDEEDAEDEGTFSKARSCPYPFFLLGDLYWIVTVG